MPYPNEHSARLQDPKKYDKYNRTKGGKLYNTITVPATISILWGHPKGMSSKIRVPQALRFPTKSWGAAEAKKWLSDNKVKTKSFEAATVKKESMLTINLGSQLFDRLREQSISTKNWAEVDKTKLPVSCFFWVENLQKRSSWHLPYREGAGGINPDTGLYRKTGAVNVNAVREALAVLGGARAQSGVKKFKSPAFVVAKVNEVAKRLKVGKFKERLFHVGAVVLTEAFMSLESALRTAIQKQFGPKCYLRDFSNKEVIFYVSSDSTEYGPETYQKVGYKIVKGEAILDTVSKPVERVIRYEDYALKVDALIELVGMENALKETK